MSGRKAKGTDGSTCPIVHPVHGARCTRRLLHKGRHRDVAGCRWTSELFTVPVGPVLRGFIDQADADAKSEDAGRCGCRRGSCSDCWPDAKPADGPTSSDTTEGAKGPDAPPLRVTRMSALAAGRLLAPAWIAPCGTAAPSSLPPAPSSPWRPAETAEQLPPRVLVDVVAHTGPGCIPAAHWDAAIVMDTPAGRLPFGPLRRPSMTGTPGEPAPVIDAAEGPHWKPLAPRPDAEPEPGDPTRRPYCPVPHYDGDRCPSAPAGIVPAAEELPRGGHAHIPGTPCSWCPPLAAGGPLPDRTPDLEAPAPFLAPRSLGDVIAGRLARAVDELEREPVTDEPPAAFRPPAGRMFVAPLGTPPPATQWRDAGELAGPLSLELENDPLEPLTVPPHLTGRTVSVSFSIADIHPDALRLLLGARPDDIRARESRKRSRAAMRQLRARAAARRRHHNREA